MDHFCDTCFYATIGFKVANHPSNGNLGPVRFALCVGFAGSSPASEPTHMEGADRPAQILRFAEAGETGAAVSMPQVRMRRMRLLVHGTRHVRGAPHCASVRGLTPSLSHSRCAPQASGLKIKTVIANLTIPADAPTPRESTSYHVLAATQDICDMIAKTAGRMTELFASWDKDCNGFVDKKEFRAACNALGVTYPNSIIDAVFDVFDEDRTGQLDHHELVRVARRAAFERGFIPKRESAPPTVLRKLDMYWARRNRLHMEAHEHEVSRLREAEENARQRSLDERRDERRSVLHSKRERAREQAIGSGLRSNPPALGSV